MRTMEEERAHNVLVRNEVKHIWWELKLQAGILGSWLAGIWGLYALNNGLLDNWIGQNFALKARSLDGLLGVLLTPFLSLTYEQAIFSSVCVLFLGWWVMLRDTRDFFVVHLTSMLTVGGAVWLFEADGTRWFGWGGIAMGMIGYLLTAGIFERRWPTILSSLAALIVLALPATFAMIPGVAQSWVAMVAGFLGGVISAAFLGSRRKASADPEGYLSGKKYVDRGESTQTVFGTTSPRTTLDFSSSKETSTATSQVSAKSR